MLSVFRAFHKRGWRGAVGLIAAYALVLQGFLAYSIASQAAVQGNSPYTGSFFVICISHDAAADGDTGAPVKPVTHCPICTLAASAVATLPEPGSLPVQWAASTGPQAFVSVAACVCFHQSRAGLSRAPPHNM